MSDSLWNWDWWLADWDLEDNFERLQRGQLANLQPAVILNCPCRCKLTVLWRDGESTHVRVHNAKSELFI